MDLSTKRCILKRGCVFPNCEETQVFAVPKNLRVSLAKNEDLIVPDQTKICRNHLKNGRWSDVKCVASNTYTPNMIENAFSLLKCSASLPQPKQKKEIGLSSEQFEELLSQLVVFNARYPKIAATALEVYLKRLRSGSTLEQLSIEYRISYGTIQNRIRIARQALLDEFVPQNLGKNKKRINF